MAVQIIQLTDKENTTTRQIAHLTNGNPVQAVRIINAANLLVHRDKRAIAPIIDAVTVQYIKSVCQLALSHSAPADHHSAACLNYYQKYRVHSACTGIAAQKTAAKIYAGVADEAFFPEPLSQMSRLVRATRLAEYFSRFVPVKEFAALLLRQSEAVLA